MRLVIQRVDQAHVTVEDETVGKIGKGLLVLVGIHKDDQAGYTEWMVSKLANMRIFSDENDKMNLSVKDIGGEVLVISQFTLYGNCNNGRRPDYINAAPPGIARPLYEKFVKELEAELGRVQQGRFAAKMQVSLVNDGPVTLIVDR